MNYMYKLHMHREKKNNGRTKSISYTESRNKTDKRYATFATRTSEQILMQKIKIKQNLTNNNNNKKKFQKYNKRNEIIIMENQSANNRRCEDSLDEIIKIELNEI